ncbi:MAG TPA: hypothetical protein VIL74_22865 [Pyrinomonadaceae bacterium]|jgi:hypothetical protein
MLNKSRFLFILVLSICVLGFSIDSKAQSLDDETVAVGRGGLTEISLPAGARRVRDEKVPAEIKDTLSKLVAAGGEGIREGEREVILWAGSYKKARGAQMIQNLEAAFRNAGWQYEAGEKNDEFATFAVFRPQPTPRALVGFFVPSEDAFVFAVSEMLKSGASRAEVPISTQQTPTQPKSNGALDQSLFGRWYRGVGGGSIDWTGKTQYKSGESYYFEFFPDGSVTYTREKDVLSIMQCRIKETQKARGRFSVSGGTLNIELGEMTSVGSDSCDAKGNFNKKLESSTLSVRFVIKKMESLARPDNPTIMCFDGSDDVCYEKVK